ncbi:MAG: diguanylate cyclase, partial [Gallionella sp.]|nr:diguanylate cyclase [Gallionella sp.]
KTENSLRKLSLAVEQSHSSIFITDLKGNIEYANAAFLKTSGYSLNEVLGKNPRMLSSGKTGRETYARMWASIHRGETWEGELINWRKDGSEYIDLTTITPLRHPDGRITNFLTVKEDITRRKQAEEEIQQLAFYDPLTKLPNRRLLMDRLKQALASTTRGKEHGALLFIDLDNFKTLNDSLGHEVGDLLLRQVAQRLEDCVREGDTVARLGGDEFVVMLAGLSGNFREAAFQSEAIGEKILASLNKPYKLSSHDCHSTPSIGITLFADHYSSIDEIMKRADISMYQAKDAGRNTIRFYDPGVQAAVSARALLEKDLRNALDNGQLQLHYQVQVDENNQAVGAEALLRWTHPSIGLVPPMKFIPLAEETGLILPIGQWILETACKQIKVWEANPQHAICSSQSTLARSNSASLISLSRHAKSSSRPPSIQNASSLN